MEAQLNPANWMLEQTAPRRESELAIDFSEIYSESALAKDSAAITARAAERAPGSKPLSFEAMKTSPITVQFNLILKRLFIAYWRMPRYNLIRFAVTIIVVFVFGSIFFGQGQNYLEDGSPATLLNIAGVIFMSVLFIGATNSMTVQGVVAQQRDVFYRERAAGMYKELPFAIAQGIVEIPFLVVQSTIYVLPLYYMIDFNPDSDKVGYFYLFFYLTLWYFTEYGATCVNISPELGIATLLSSFW